MICSSVFGSFAKKSWRRPNELGHFRFLLYHKPSLPSNDGLSSLVSFALLILAKFLCCSLLLCLCHGYRQSAGTTECKSAEGFQQPTGILLKTVKFNLHKKRRSPCFSFSYLNLTTFYRWPNHRHSRCGIFPAGQKPEGFSFPHQTHRTQSFLPAS